MGVTKMLRWSESSGIFAVPAAVRTVRVQLRSMSCCELFERNQEMAKRLVVTGFLMVAVLFALSGCAAQGEAKEATKAKEVKETKTVQQTKVAPEAKVSHETKAAQETKVAPQAEEVKSQKVVLRVNCGATEPYTDKAGNVWLADQFFEKGKKWGVVGGMTAERSDLGITGTNTPKIYETECYSMSDYDFIVPNGKYTVRLHFAETYDGITGAGQRVFSVTINDKVVLKDLDVYKETGGLNKPLVKEFKGVTPTSGALTIGFVPNVENPEINGIEVISE
jgi:hypothetical protein